MRANAERRAAGRELRGEDGELLQPSESTKGCLLLSSSPPLLLSFYPSILRCVWGSEIEKPLPAFRILLLSY